MLRFPPSQTLFSFSKHDICEFNYLSKTPTHTTPLRERTHTYKHTRAPSLIRAHTRRARDSHFEVFIFFEVPRLFLTSTIVVLQTARSFVILSSPVALIPYHVDRLSIICIRWHPVYLSPSIFPVCSNYFLSNQSIINR